MTSASGELIVPIDIQRMESYDPALIWKVWDAWTVDGLHLAFHTTQELGPREALAAAKEMLHGCSVRMVRRMK